MAAKERGQAGGPAAIIMFLHGRLKSECTGTDPDDNVH